MTVFVTGGTGFVGSHLAEALVARGDTVRALVRSAPKWLDGVPIEAVAGGLLDAEALRAGLDGVDTVFHVAGLTRAPDQATLDRANVDGTTALLDAVREAAPTARVVITSSQAAAGPSPVRDGRAVPIDETASMRPVSMYGRSKARMESIVRERYGGDLDIVMTRPSAVYGPREADIFTMIQTAARQRVFPVVGSGDAPRLSLVHVADLVRGLIAAADTPKTSGRTYFLASEVYYTWDTIYRAIREALGVRVLRVNVPPALVTPIGATVETFGRLTGQYPPLNRDKAREAREAWLCSVEAAMEDFGFRQQVPLEAGMRETVAWYRAEGWLR